MNSFLIQTLILFLSIFFWANFSLCSQTKEAFPEDQTITLKKAIEIALQNNRSLQRSRLNIASSNLSVETSKKDFNIKVRPETSAGFYSSDNQYWSGALEFSKKNELGITSSITPKIERNGDLYQSSVNVSLNVPLLQGFGSDYNLDGLYSSLYELENTKRSYYQHQVQVVIDTVSTVYEIIKDQQQNQLLVSQIQLLEQHLTLTKIKEKTGLATAMDMYRAEIRLKEVQTELSRSREQLEKRVDRLKDLLAKPMKGDLTVTASVEYNPVETNTQEAINIALKNRIEIEQAERLTQESKRKMILAKKNILPRLDLKMGYEKYGENRSFDLTDENWTISVDGSSDLFRSEQRTQFEQARIHFQQTKIDLESQKQNVIREVRAHLNQMEKKKKRIKDRLEQAKQAEGKLALANSKFNHGLADNFDLLEAQAQNQQVQSELLFETIGYIVDTYSLRKIIGTLIVR